jgi:hypothetical protein
MGHNWGWRYRARNRERSVSRRQAVLLTVAAESIRIRFRTIAAKSLSFAKRRDGRSLAKIRRQGASGIA